MTQQAQLRWMSARPHSKLHEPKTAAVLGIALGVTFMLCFATGLLSHLISQPPEWFDWPSRPAGFYRVSQGVHTVTGFISIPILLAKGWTVYPKLFEWPPVRSVAHALERLSILPLLGGGLFMLISGTANVARWYPWTFFFPSAHYWVAWVVIGALFIHVGAKWTLVRSTIGRTRHAEPAVDVELASERRLFLRAVAATTAIVGAAVAGNTVGPLSRISVLAQRRPGTGPQRLPVNKSARGAGVATLATRADYRLIVEGRVATRLELSIADLAALPQRSAELPIACVEGWSTSAKWTGVSIATLLEMAGADSDRTISVESMQRGGLYRRADLSAVHAADPDTLLALQLNDEALHIDHGYPARLIGPNRPGVMQTKWVNRLVVK